MRTFLPTVEKSRKRTPEVSKKNSNIFRYLRHIFAEEQHGNQGQETHFRPP